MKTTDWQQASCDYKRVERAIAYLEKNFLEQPSLREIAESVSLSEYHFQRLFRRWAGISPKRFLQYLTLEYAKSLLEKSENLLNVTYESGLSSPGRLHDLFVSCDAVTPGDYKSRGEGLVIEYGFHPSPFGTCLLLKTGRGICGLAFALDDDPDASLEKFRKRWRRAVFVENHLGTAPLFKQIFEPGDPGRHSPLHLHIRGTNFQIKVWQALLSIPMGAVVSYSKIAGSLGMPRGSRAVGTAIGQNPISFLIPCHRVLRKSARISGYAWGPRRKRIILGWEAAQTDTAHAADSLR